MVCRIVYIPYKKLYVAVVYLYLPLLTLFNPNLYYFPFLTSYSFTVVAHYFNLLSSTFFSLTSHLNKFFTHRIFIFTKTSVSIFVDNKSTYFRIFFLLITLNFSDLKLFLSFFLISLIIIIIISKWIYSSLNTFLCL